LVGQVGGLVAPVIAIGVASSRVCISYVFRGRLILEELR
jgi:hypothetical protein